MFNIVAARLAQAFVVIFLAYALTFILFNVLPSDPIAIRYATDQGALSVDELSAIRDYYGLNGSILTQFWVGAANLLRGQLGFSITHGEPVATILADALPSTLVLTAFSLLGGVLFAAVVAIAASYSRFAALRNLLRSAPAVFASVPTFLVGLLFIQFFSFQLGLVPAIDDSSIASLVGPVVTLSIFVSAPLAQVFYRSLEKAKAQSFVRVAEAKGAGPAFLLWRHVARNAITPVLTIAGLTFGELIAGSVITESVFARSGIGRATLEAVMSQDYPVIQAIVMFAAIAYVLINLGVDLLYPLIDPRMRDELRNGRSRA